MASIKVSLLTSFAKLANPFEFSMEIKEGEKVKDLIEKLHKKCGNAFFKVLYDENHNIPEDVVILQNGVNITLKPENGFLEPLLDKQEYVFCNMISMG
jgi:hypothetical protein